MNPPRQTALALAALVAIPLASAETFPLVDGATEAVIVGNGDIPKFKENGNQELPAFLQGWVEKSTGRKLRAVKESEYDPKTMPHAIFLGNTKAAQEKFGEQLRKLDRDAYIVSVTPNAVYLVGARPHSSMYAQADFLESFLGVATYLPTSWGTIVPRHEKVVVPEGTRVEQPAFTSRAFSALRHYREKPGVLDYAGNVEIPWRMYRRDTFSHALHQYITVKEFGESHPEYFPEVNGKRVIVSGGTDPGPCISNPEVREVIIRKARAFFDDPKNADADIISMGMTDGGWCECAKCRTLDGNDVRGLPSKSRRYYDFLNAVAKALRASHPGKSVGVLGYAGADWPPADMAVERNIVPYICSQRSTWGDPEVVKAHMAQLRAWTERVDRVGVYEYLYGSGYFIPRLYSRHLAEYLRAAVARGPGGFYAEIYSNHGLDGPKAWVTEKLTWNPKLDPDELRGRWCRAVFDEAAAPMEAFFAFAEECLDRNVGRTPTVAQGYVKPRDSKFYLLQHAGQFEWFPPEDLRRARGFLDQALAAAKRPEIRQRVEYFASTFRLTELTGQTYHAYAAAKQAAEAKASPAKVLALLIEGDASAATEDPLEYARKLVEADPTKLTLNMAVTVATGTELALAVGNGAPWDAVRAALANGARSAAPLREAARKAVLGMAPADWQKDKVASDRVERLLAMASRVAVAKKVAAPPAIDGDLKDPAWEMQDDAPWFLSRSGLRSAENPTRHAFCHDGRFLYVAFQCAQPGLDKEKGSDRYGTSAWKFPSVELFLAQDGPADAPEPPPFFFAIPCLDGGLYASQHEVVKEWKESHTADAWQVEMKIDLAALGWTPDKFPALRVNMVRNLREHFGRPWFPVAIANKDPLARGWLVFE